MFQSRTGLQCWYPTTTSALGRVQCNLTSYQTGSRLRRRPLGPERCCTPGSLQSRSRTAAVSLTACRTSARSAEPVSMRVASADRAAGARMGRASMRREHTTSLARCEGARGSPGAHPGQTCSAHRLAATSRSLVTGGDTAVPFARAVVIVRRRKLPVNQNGAVIGPNARPSTVPR